MKRSLRLPAFEEKNPCSNTLSNGFSSSAYQLSLLLSCPIFKLFKHVFDKYCYHHMNVHSVQEIQIFFLIQKITGSLDGQIPALLDCSQHVTLDFLVIFIYHIVTKS